MKVQAMKVQAMKAQVRRVLLAAVTLGAAVAPATVAASGDDPAAITLVTHDSFTTEDTTLGAALDSFTDQTGIEVEVLHAGDAGVMVSKAILTAGNPEGDVLYGIDNTYLSRAVDADVFEPYTAAGLDAVAEQFRAPAIPAEGADPIVTPIDYGDVCVNIDSAWFEEHDVAPPTDLQSLTDPAYKDLLVVENPASSSPGLAFLLGTIAEFGDGWTGYWEDLAANGVQVVDDWSAAYLEQFSAIGGGDRPLAVSYGSSPPFEIAGATDASAAPVTTALEATCFRQIEFAGVLAGTDAPDEARRLVDFMVSTEFQDTITMNLYMFPVNGETELPPEFVEFAVIPDEPLTLDPIDIAANRDGWIETWTDTVLR